MKRLCAFSVHCYRKENITAAVTSRYFRTVLFTSAATCGGGNFISSRSLSYADSVSVRTFVHEYLETANRNILYYSNPNMIWSLSVVAVVA